MIPNKLVSAILFIAATIVVNFIQGQMLDSQPISDQLNYQFPSMQLSAGTYLIVMENEEGQIEAKKVAIAK